MKNHKQSPRYQYQRIIYRLTGTRKSGTNKSVPLLYNGKPVFPGKFLIVLNYD